MKQFILFDTETTGTEQEDRIIQIGAIILEPKSKELVYDELCKSEVDIKLEAMEIHNITQELIENKPNFIETDFYKKLLSINNKDNYLIAHNINFDLTMLEKEGFENNLTTIDTLRCAMHLLPDSPYHRLQYLRYSLDLYKKEKQEAEKLNITIKAHDALGDVLIMKLLLTILVNEVRQQFPNTDVMGKLAELTQKPVLMKTFKFGKHKGKNIEEIAQTDISYLKWMRNNLDLDENMTFTLDNYL